MIMMDNEEPTNKKFDFFKAGWSSSFFLSRYMGTKITIIYHGFAMHVNMYWFLNYHPEDTKHDSRKIEDDPSKLSAYFVDPRGFNKINRDFLLLNDPCPRMNLDMERIRVTERIAFVDKKTNITNIGDLN